MHFEPVGDARWARGMEVRDIDGNVIRTIPPGKALDIASGEPLD